MARDDHDWIFNLDDETQGIPRTLAPGITTRIFPGDQAMLSVVRIAPHSEGTLHSHPQEQWGVLLRGACLRIQDGREVATSGTHLAASRTACGPATRARWCSTSSPRRATNTASPARVSTIDTRYGI